MIDSTCFGRIAPPNKIARSQRPLGLSALVLFFCLFGNLGAVGLVGPDEPRYVWIARAMAATGDWVTPRLYGQPWFEKPILYYWARRDRLSPSSSRGMGVRLPSAFAALAAALAIGWLARKHYGAARRTRRPHPRFLRQLLFATTVASNRICSRRHPGHAFQRFHCARHGSAPRHFSP